MSSSSPFSCGSRPLTPVVAFERADCRVPDAFGLRPDGIWALGGHVLDDRLQAGAACNCGALRVSGRPFIPSVSLTWLVARLPRLQGLLLAHCDPAVSASLDDDPPAEGQCGLSCPPPPPSPSGLCQGYQCPATETVDWNRDTLGL